MGRLITYALALALGVALCGAGCRRDEPAAPPERRPEVPPEEAGDDKGPHAGPLPDAADEEALLAMAAEARRATKLELYYSPYRVSCHISGDLDSCFGDLGARYLLVMGYRGSEQSYTRYPAKVDRWNLFFGDRASAQGLVGEEASYEAEAERRQLYPEEEARLAEIRLALAAAERAALADFRLALVAEVAGRRFPLDSAAAGTLLSVPDPPGWMAP